VEHLNYMQRCLDLALLGQGNVAPNPMVGCVIVHKGRVIGEGYHQRYGEAHAEVNAVRTVSDRSLLQDSTMYVSLEPCSHFGKTPPCADLIVDMGIPEVFIATEDPFAKVAGRGIAKLRDKGIRVHVGLLRDEAIALNRRFFLFHAKKRPYIVLKWAETQDGFVDGMRSGDLEPALPITSPPANVLTHLWRSQESAIMVGTRTALLDDPSLTVRHVSGKNPVRIVIDRQLTLPSDLRLFDGQAPVIVVNEVKDGRIGLMQQLRVNDVRDLNEVLTALHGADVQSLLVEGGPALLNSFLDNGLWDETRRYISPQRIVEGVSAPVIALPPDSIENIGPDRLLHYHNPRPA
jgi:diaminohydroxyphosphoribosylaminopyrimidine deaminase / 5-amino-6-(5-phosphoribosylamino)uracil reductase